MGNSLWHLGKHAESLENHFKALQIRENLKDIRGIAVSKSNIGMVYQSQEKLPLAEKYILEALQNHEQLNEPNLKINSLHTLANIYGMQGKIKQALEIDEEGIALADKTNNEFAKALFYDNMGNCFMYGTPPDYAKALQYFRMTLQIDSAFSNKKQMSDSYVNMGTVFLIQGKYNEAIPYLNRSVLLADESGYVQGKVKALEALSSAYQKSGQVNLAFTTLQKSVRTKDSLVNASSEAKIAELQTVYETEKQQQQINLQQAELSKKNFILTSTILLSVLVLLLGFSAYRRYKLQERSRMQTAMIRQQELATKAVIKAEEDERQRIARDLHDGVGQMMSAAKMNLSAFESEMNFSNSEHKIEFEKIIGLVDESCREIRSVSHNMMPNALLRNSLSSAIRDFIDKIEGKTLKIHLFTEGLDERLDADVEIVLYRVIQECVNNVIKHANATTLDITIIKDKDGISATVEDNGKGFDSKDTRKFEGIGMRNIITRVEYLKGTVEFDSAPGRGTAVGINVPLNS
jgi:signal transduction histidine kinase